MSDLSKHFPEKVPDEIPGPMHPIYHNLRRAAQAFANVIETSKPSGSDASAEIEKVKEVFDSSVDAVRNWKG